MFKNKKASFVKQLPDKKFHYLFLSHGASLIFVFSYTGVCMYVRFVRHRKLKSGKNHQI